MIDKYMIIDDEGNEETIPVSKESKLEAEIERLKADYQQANEILAEQSEEIERLKKELEEEKEETDYYQAIVEHWEW